LIQQVIFSYHVLHGIARSACVLFCSSLFFPWCGNKSQFSHFVKTEAKLPVLFILPTQQTPAGSLAFNLLGFVCQYSPKGFSFSLQFETPTLASISVNPLFRSTVKLAVAFTTMSSHITTLLMMGC
jgi:hypothetical protein